MYVYSFSINSIYFSANLTRFVDKLNEGLLTAYGRKENFDLGVTARILYGKLLDSFTEVPVFTTESNSRMVSTAQNFAAVSKTTLFRLETGD